jgi:hypothetical protein
MNIKYHENLYIINSAGREQGYSVSRCLELLFITASAIPKKGRPEGLPL